MLQQKFCQRSKVFPCVRLPIWNRNHNVLPFLSISKPYSWLCLSVLKRILDVFFFPPNLCSNSLVCNDLNISLKFRLETVSQLRHSWHLNWIAAPPGPLLCIVGCLVPLLASAHQKLRTLFHHSPPPPPGDNRKCPYTLTNVPGENIPFPCDPQISSNDIICKLIKNANFKPTLTYWSRISGAVHAKWSLNKLSRWFWHAIKFEIHRGPDPTKWDRTWLLYGWFWWFSYWSELESH